MTALSKSALKSLWKAYFEPTGADFDNLIDSWTDYQIGLQVLGQAISAAGVGVSGGINYFAPDNVVFSRIGSLGRNLLAENTPASGRSRLGLSVLATQTEISAANITPLSISALQVAPNSLTLDGFARATTPGASLLGQGGTSDAAYDRTDVRQVVRATLSTVATTGANIPYDDTEPLGSEGGEFLEVVISPTQVGSLLVAEASVNVSSTSGASIVGIFNEFNICLSTVARNIGSTGGAMYPIRVFATVTASTLAARYFRLRAGASAGTITINGEAGVGLLGGTAISSLTVTEIVPPQ